MQRKEEFRAPTREGPDRRESELKELCDSLDRHELERLREQAANGEMSSKQLLAVVGSAERGEPQAQYLLASFLASGSLLKRDEPRAFYWYVRAAEQGHADAQYETGRLLETGVPGVLADTARARAWYERSAAAGNDKARNALAALEAGAQLREQGAPEPKRGDGSFVDAMFALLNSSRYESLKQHPSAFATAVKQRLFNYVAALFILLDSKSHLSELARRKIRGLLAPPCRWRQYEALRNNSESLPVEYRALLEGYVPTPPVPGGIDIDALMAVEHEDVRKAALQWEMADLREQLSFMLADRMLRTAIGRPDVKWQGLCLMALYFMVPGKDGARYLQEPLLNRLGGWLQWSRAMAAYEIDLFDALTQHGLVPRDFRVPTKEELQTKLRFYGELRACCKINP